MDFQLTEEQKAIQNMIQDMLTNECPPEYIEEMEAKEEFPQKIWDLLADSELLGACLPEEFGGSDQDVITMSVIIEELAKHWPDLAFAYVTNVSLGGKTLYYFGNEAQKKNYIPKFVKGELKFALALTEPGGGTDVLGAMRTRAKAVDNGDKYIINGQKMFITCADIADYIFVLARTNVYENKTSKGITTFMVDRNTAGVSVRPVKKLGLNSIHSCDVFFEDVEVSKEQIVGQLDNGWYHLLDTLNNERIVVAAQCLGIAQGAFDRALLYAQQRVAFGKIIGQFQAIQHYLAEMAVKIETSRLITHKAAWLQSQHLPCGVESTMAKLVASETAFEVSSKAMQILGGSGFSMEFDVQRFFRDSRLFTVAPITNEMAKNFIGQNLGLPKSY